MTDDLLLQSIEETNRLRRICMRDKNTDFCIGCGTHTTNPEGHTGTSRWNPDAWLCTPCCEYEAMSGHTDPFDTGLLPGGGHAT